MPESAKQRRERYAREAEYNRQRRAIQAATELTAAQRGIKLPKPKGRSTGRR